MAHEFTTWAYKQDLPMATKFVLVALADRANHEGYCWPSREDLARMTGQTARSVQNQINKLEELGYLEKEERRRKDGYRASNGYYLSISSEPRSHEQPSPEPVSCENDDISQVNDVPTNINPPSEALLEPSVEPSGAFEKFWQVCRRKVGKGAAEKAHAAALKHATAEEILDAMQRYADSVATEDPKFIPHPATWLNQKRWLDEIAPQPEPAKPVDLTGQPAWKAEIAAAHGPHALTWLNEAELEGDTVFASSRHKADWIRTNYSPQLAKHNIKHVEHRGNQ